MHAHTLAARNAQPAAPAATAETLERDLFSALRCLVLAYEMPTAARANVIAAIASRGGVDAIPTGTLVHLVTHAYLTHLNGGAA